MSISIHYPAKNRIASYNASQENEQNEDELQEDDEEEEEIEWSDEEYLEGSSDDDDEFEDDDDEDDEFDDDFDSETEEDDHEYVDDEDSHYRNNYSTKPGYVFYPEQPYIGPPIVPKPSPKASSSKLSYYVLSPICDIAMIYIKFAILAILIYACALWYTVYYGELSDMDNDDDADTCPAN